MNALATSGLPCSFTLVNMSLVLSCVVSSWN